MKHYLPLMFALILALAGNGCAVDTRPVVTVYAYHSDPPLYLPEKNNDLSQEWVKKFNHWQDQVEFRLVHLQRTELNRLVDAGKPYVILWANPLWFAFRDSQLQSSEPIFWDADIVISSSQQPLQYQGPEDFRGLRLGGRKGFYYKGLEQIIEDRELLRVDVGHDIDNYQRLSRNEIDAFIMTRASFLYWQQHKPELKELYVARTPHDAYSRHLLVSHGYQNLLPLINDFVEHCAQSLQWQARLKYWGVEKLLNPFELEFEELMDIEPQQAPDDPKSPTSSL
ncbi:substrate-binding periplasmic protein [Lacimicrobium alkaliphilum]|uniref:Uncharacterized protein n=1 Tax=Lacimicrobium alkaliphilum TaxID=1526571 RepID=A0A0U3AYC1_9ALTE|nr:transporter substrate-binding domain-containing protein [Lacimicrobium alkaliphilum]ALS97976.1 hypothetical protein AT746_06665 [Lacimicrobium alkaliphilum]